MIRGFKPLAELDVKDPEAEATGRFPFGQCGSKTDLIPARTYRNRGRGRCRAGLKGRATGLNSNRIKSNRG